MRTLLALTVVAGLALTSCSGDKNSPEDAASELAAGLSAGKIPSGVQGADVQTAYDDIVAGLGEDAEATVEVSGVDEGSDDAATATLSWTWTLGDQEWTYDTEAEITRTDGTWSAQWAPAVVEPTLEDGDALQSTSIIPAAADITGAGGVALVKDRRVERFGLDKSKLSPTEAVSSARQVATILGVSVAPYVKLVKASGDKAFVEALTLRPADARAVPAEFGEIPGALAIGDKMPLAPTREFAAPILGRVGPATAEIIKESDGRIQAGDEVGLSGLQQRYDEELAGKPGLRVDVVGENGETAPVFEADPQDGEALATTLDLTLQNRAEQVLAVPDPDAPGPATALVAIRPSDRSDPRRRQRPGGRRAEHRDLRAVRARLDVQGRVLAGAAAQRADPGEPGHLPADGRGRRQGVQELRRLPVDGLGTITLREAVANSCNTAFISSRDKIGKGDLADAAASLGSASTTTSASRRTSARCRHPGARPRRRRPHRPGQGARLSDGHGGGRRLGVRRPDRRAAPPRRLPARGGPASAAHRGRGGRAARADAGRGDAGVGQHGARGRPGRDRRQDRHRRVRRPRRRRRRTGSLPTHAWMIATRGDLAVAVFVETGESGSQSAGPLMSAFLGG